VTGVKRTAFQFPSATASAESTRELPPRRRKRSGSNDATNLTLQHHICSNCSRPSLQLQRHKNFHPQALHLQQTAVDQVCSSRDTRISKLQTPSFVWQIKPTIPSVLLHNQSLQLQLSFSSLLPTATPCTTFGNSDLTVTPQDHLLMQPGTVDCPCICPCSTPKCFLPWQLLLPTGIAPGHRPTAAEVRAFEASWHAAARSVPSHRGGGILGHVGMVMPTAQHRLAIPNTVAWIDPVPPVQPLVIPNNTSAVLTSVMVRQHTADLEEFSKFVANMNTLRSLFLDNIDNVLIGHLRDRLLIFAGVHPRDMVQHLIATCAAVTADELESNATALHAPWDPSQPIEGLCVGQSDLSIQSQSQIEPHSRERSSSVRTNSTTSTLVEQTMCSNRAHFFWLTDLHQQMHRPLQPVGWMCLTSARRSSNQSNDSAKRQQLFHTHARHQVPGSSRPIATAVLCFKGHLVHTRDPILPQDPDRPTRPTD